MNTLLLYATNSGSTQMASQIAMETLVAKGNQVLMKMISEATFEEISGYDLTILASPSWDFDGKEGQPHEDFVKFMDANQGKSLEGKKLAILGLGDSSYMYFCGAVDHLEEFVKNLKGQLPIASLKIDGFYFQQEKNTQLVKDWAESLVKTPDA